MLKFQESIKKDVEFTAVAKKNSCGISIGLDFSPWNFHGVPHNLWNIQRWSFGFSRIPKVKVTNPKIRRSYFFWNSNFRSRCLHMLRNQSLAHEIFCFQCALTLTSPCNMVVNQFLRENLIPSLHSAKESRQNERALVGVRKSLYAKTATKKVTSRNKKHLNNPSK